MALNIFKRRCFTCNKKLKLREPTFTVKMTTHSRVVCSDCISTLMSLRSLGQMKEESEDHE